VLSIRSKRIEVEGAARRDEQQRHSEAQQREVEARRTKNEANARALHEVEMANTIMCIQQRAREEADRAAQEAWRTSVARAQRQSVQEAARLVKEQEEYRQARRQQFEAATARFDAQEAAQVAKNSAWEEHWGRAEDAQRKAQMGVSSQEEDADATQEEHGDARRRGAEESPAPRKSIAMAATNAIAVVHTTLRNALSVMGSVIHRPRPQPRDSMWDDETILLNQLAVVNEEALFPQWGSTANAQHETVSLQRWPVHNDTTVLLHQVPTTNSQHRSRSFVRTHMDDETILLNQLAVVNEQALFPRWGSRRRTRNTAAGPLFERTWKRLWNRNTHRIRRIS
jgi:hypothetical protein